MDTIRPVRRVGRCPDCKVQLNQQLRHTARVRLSITASPSPIGSSASTGTSCTSHATAGQISTEHALEPLDLNSDQATPARAPVVSTAPAGLPKHSSAMQKGTGVGTQAAARPAGPEIRAR